LSPKLQLLVAQDLFLNASSSLADYVLPAAHWLEKPFFSMGLGYIGFAGDYVEAKPAPLTLEYDHHSDYDFWRDLGRRLDQGGHWPDTAEAFWDGCLRPAGLDFNTLCTRNGPVMGDAARRRKGTQDGGARPAYGTPSGKIELRSSLLAEWGQDPLPAFDPPDIFRANTAAYPLVLTTGGRKIEGFHQDAQQMSWFRRKNPDPLVSIHPVTAAQAGITDGDWAWIETPIGRVRQRARLTPDLLPNVVHADRWWYPERSEDPDDPYSWRTTNINVCTDDAIENCDPVMGTWLLRGVPCRVVPEPGE
ncbi:MAG: molybdopterin dinucleotide binding domain-containing protein, partial [Gammaproteobacteria bacterium]